MKKFTLIVSYESGRVSMLTDTPDLTTALQQFNNKLRVVYGDDKGSMLPNVIKAEILPLVYTETQTDQKSFAIKDCVV